MPRTNAKRALKPTNNNDERCTCATQERRAIKARDRLKQIASVALLMSLALVLLAPLAAYAQEASEKVVRVGWYDSTYNSVDQYGRRSGYAYEYQLKISAYSGWRYEYVNGSWSELLQMLIDGKIDLMSDVSYTEERAKNMLFSDQPMGTEEYYLFVAPSNEDISPTDTSTINGKRVGVAKDSLQAGLYRKWAQQNGVKAEVVELVASEDDFLRLLNDRKLDAYVTVDSFVKPEHAMPLYKVGSSDFFFAVNKDRPDLLAELNSALSSIHTEDRHFNNEMFERFVEPTGANAFLSAEEKDWLSGHESIRVGYQDDYLAFCGTDKSTGKLTGALKDYLAYAQNCMENAQLSFDPKAYPTAEAALEALKEGEVDCVFPASLGGYDAEKQDMVVTHPLMSTDVYAVVRQADMNNFTNREHVVVAVNEGNPNYDAFLIDHYPRWQTVYYKTTEDCLKAVHENMADCVLISSYRYNNISRLCERYHLTTFPTGESLDSCFAIEAGNRELYSILSKVVGQVPDSAVNSALSFYITEDAKRTLSDFLADNAVIVMASIVVVLLVITALLLRSMRAERLAKDLISATEIDSLTGLYNKDYFFQYANRMRSEQPDVPMDAIVLNIERFHSINAFNGRDFGDRVLRVLGNDIRIIAMRASGIAGRFGADRFDIFCEHTENYQSIYSQLQSKLEGMAPNTSIRLRMGVLPEQTQLDPVQMFDMARTACGMARGQSQEHVVIFDERVRKRELYEQRLLNDLRRALDNFEFEVHYQPKFNIQAEPPKLVSAEALIRWRHPELGMIAPDDFIPLLEQNGKIEEVDKYAWSEAARQVAHWRTKYGVLIPVSVNLSRIDVFNPKLEDTLDGILKKNGLDYDAIKLEVTESAYMENADQLIRVVGNLRRKGYTVEMDDFGTGYSSLNMLSTIPIDVLKMDRVFIQNIEDDQRTTQMVELILGIAKSMNLTVVAEGVETESQLHVLKSLGCEVVQGYYFSRPLHPTEFETEHLGDLGR